MPMVVWLLPGAWRVTYFNADDGELLWTDSVATSATASIEGIGDIRAHPIHDGGLSLSSVSLEIGRL